MYDAIVVGLGAMGSASLRELARRGQRVVGIDRFSPPHGMGSSHGKSRIIREAYFEDPRYVPLVQHAYKLWPLLEQESGESLFVQTGGLMLGPADGALVSGARLSAELHGLPHDMLSAAQVATLFPVFRPDSDMIGVWEPRAGVLAPERAIAVMLDSARRFSADVRLNEPMLSWSATDDGVHVVTAHGEYRASKLILSVGAWTRDVVSELALPLVVQRNAVYWFDQRDSSAKFDAAHFPIFLCECASGQTLYGFPDMGDGIKLALHHHGPAVHPDTVDRVIGATELDELRVLIEQYLPQANGPLRDTTVCLYTNAPDEHFVIDAHPHHGNVIVASPCSGHGFKFAPVIGELLADLATGVTPRFDLSAFALGRPAF